MKTTKETTIANLWLLMEALKWDEAAELLHEDFEAVWPQSQVKFTGRTPFIEMNRNYPGKHKFTIKRISSAGDKVISEVLIESYIDPEMLKGSGVESKGQEEVVSLYAVSIYEFEADKVKNATEYWGDTYEPPAWQAKYFERL